MSAYRQWLSAAFAAAVLMVLVGMLRALGAVLLLAGGPAAAPGVLAGAVATRSLGAVMLGLALVEIGLAMLVLRGSARAILPGVAATAALWLDALVNGWALYGAPRAEGVVINTIIAGAIVALLLAARRKGMARGERRTA